MNWLRDQLNKQNTYYTAVDPADFYEWKISQRIPKGARFSRQLPPSEVFTKGFVVASADLQSSSLKCVAADMFELMDDVDVDVQFKIGTALSASELLDKYHKMKEKFAKDLDHFRKNILSQEFLLNPTDNNRAVVAEYETFPNIQKQLIEARRKVTEDSCQKKGRAYEQEKLRRFEKVFVMFNNKNTLMEPSDIAKIFTVSEVRPIRETQMTWLECFVKMSPDAKDKHDRISALESLQWIKEADQLS